MDPQDIASIVRRQRAFFATGATLDVDYRLDALRRLRAWARRGSPDGRPRKQPLGAVCAQER